MQEGQPREEKSDYSEQRNGHFPLPADTPRSEIVDNTESNDSVSSPPENPSVLITETTVSKPSLLIPLNIFLSGVMLADERHLRVLKILATTNFPVGNVGQAYSAQINLSTILKERDTISIPEFDDINGEESRIEGLPLDTIGLSIHIENGVLSIQGNPKKDFDGNLIFRIEFNFKGKRSYKDYGADSVISKTSIDPLSLPRPFLINPNPEALWKDLEPPTDGPYWKGNEDSQTMIIGNSGKIILAASKRGRSHAHEGRFRDDHFAMKMDERTGWYFLAVADGAGSTPYSREGSRIACENMIKNTADNFAVSDEVLRLDDDTIHLLESGTIISAEFIERTGLYGCFHKSLYNTWTAIRDEAIRAEAKRKIQDYHTTLLFSAMKRFEDRWLLVTYWVGDGGLAVYRPNGLEEVWVMGTPDGGEFAGQTKFFTMKDEIDAEPIKRRMRVTVLKDFDSIFMMTDGITDPFFPAESNIADYAFWGEFKDNIFPKHFPGVFELGNTPEQKTDALLKGLNFYTKGNHDDRTMLIVMNQDKLSAAVNHKNTNE